MASRFYVTTAIDYVNAEPHLGHAYEKMVTDCLARYHRQVGDDSFFLVGTDEHGQKIARAAEAQGETPEAFTDRLSERFRACYDALGISYDRFVRTTEPAHEAAVQGWFRRAHASGDIYLADYEGLYCVACEAFYQGKDLIDGTLCPVHRRPVQKLAERNLFFRLTKYAERLRDHIESHQEFVLPAIRRNEVLAMLDEGLTDISVSRASVPWGVPVPPEIPGASGHTVYVWIDALLNYVTALGYPDERYREWWLGEDGGPNALHVIGKDISRFHCLIWPAMLLSAGIPLSRSIFVHGFINMGGEKLAKTGGRLVDPLEVAGRFGVDALRYYVLREVPFGRDGEYSTEQLVERYNTDLANELGNLASRTTSMLHRYRGGRVPERWAPGAREREMAAFADRVSLKVSEAFRSLEPSVALEAAWTLVKRANRFVEETKPWDLARRKEEEALDASLVALLEAARLSAVWAWPAMPAKCEELWGGLGLEGTPGRPGPDPLAARRWFAGGTSPPNAGRELPPVQILFPKIETPVGPTA
jgi:methionyl-tRNA synthetase